MSEPTLSGLQQYASQYLVGGISSSFRANPYTTLPMYLDSADGAYIYDATGKKYVDYFMGHGAALLGHNRPEIKKAIVQILEKGFTAEFDNSMTVELAKRLTEIIPCAERVRFTNSGSEATSLAMRLARGVTGKEKIMRIDGHFHGVHDYVLFNNLAALVDKQNNGDRESHINLFSDGIPKAVTNTQIIIPWNDIEIFDKITQKRRHEIAAIMLNPIDYNNGCITTTKEYLSAILDIAHQKDILVIFDEILSGFRTGLSCAQGYYGVIPDICTIGKALSNGVPLAAIAGQEEIMSAIWKADFPVIHGGTFSGNLLGVSAAHAALDIMTDPDFYPNLFNVATHFFEHLQTLFDAKGVPARVQYLGSNFFIYFGIREPVTSYSQFDKLDREMAKKFLTACIDEGIYFHTDFTVSAAHTKSDVDRSLDIIEHITRRIL
jgi:glutamate-1-semialdehyde 2,1-aminomutase